MRVLAFALAAACLSGCTTAGLYTAAGAYGMSRAAYCNLPEETRAAIRAKATDGYVVITCRPPGDVP